MPSPSHRALAHPVWFGVGVMVAWQAVVYGFGSLDLPWLLPGWFPHLGVVVTNGLGALVVLLVGWRTGLLGRSGLGAGRDWWWVAPLVVIALAYLVIGRDGVPGLTGSAGYLLSAAAGMAAVGVSEELAGRGVGLAPAGSRLLPLVVVSVVFGVGHIGNWLFFSASLCDTLWQILGATISGFCWSAGRVRMGTIWPLAFVHGLSDWSQLNSPGAAPFWFQVAVMAFELGYGGRTLWLLRGGLRSPAGALP